MNYWQEVEQRRQEIRTRQRQKWAEASQSCARAVDDVIRDLAETSGNECAEVQIWEDWAKRIIYGEDYQTQDGHVPGLPKDLRSWVKDRIAIAQRSADDVVQKLQAENLRLREELAITKVRMSKTEKEAGAV